MRWTLALLFAAACTGSTTDVTDDTDTDTDADSDSDTDTGEPTEDPWDTGDPAGGGGDDTFSFGHPDIGATPLDGAWVGTFEYREAWGQPSGDPICAGTAEFVVDGTSALHVSGTLTCDTWDPNFDPAILNGIFDLLPLPPSLIPSTEYGAMTGLLVSELDPSNFSRSDAIVNLAAINMNPYDKGIVARWDADAGTLSMEKNLITNVLIRNGTKFTLEATRQPTE